MSNIETILSIIRDEEGTLTVLVGDPDTPPALAEWFPSEEFMDAVLKELQSLFEMRKKIKKI